jgi:hypothetical protein
MMDCFFSLVRTTSDVMYKVRDGSEAVKAKVAKKVEKSKLPTPLKNFAAIHAPQAASDFTTPETMAKMMGKNLGEKLPKKCGRRV